MGSKDVQEEPKMLQEAPKTLQELPKTLQEASKRLEAWLQRRPRGGQEPQNSCPSAILQQTTPPCKNYGCPHENQGFHRSAAVQKASLEGQVEPKWRLEASLEGLLESKRRLEASLEGKMEFKWR